MKPMSEASRYHTAGILLVLFLSIGGLVVGTIIFLYGTGLTPESNALIQSSEFITWMFVNEVLFALYPLSIALVWKAMHQIGEHSLKRWLEIAVSTVIVFALYFLPGLIGRSVIGLRPPPLEYADVKLPLLEAVGFAAGAFPLTLGIWRIQIALRDGFSQIKVSDFKVGEYIRLKDYLQRFLLGLGVLLSIGILTSAALRKLVLATGQADINQFPPIFLLLIGAYQTLLIALVYFPAYIELVSVGNRILNAYYSLPEPHAASWGDAYGKRKTFEEYLDLKVSGEQRFVTNLTILAPFVGGLFSLLVGQ
jgi:hypothetical protein